MAGRARTRSASRFAASLALLLLACVVAAAPAASGAADGPEAALKYSNGIFWWIHLSDVHVSKFVGSRARDMEKHFTQALRIIRPPLLLITGDLTDAKNQYRTRTYQFQEEWETYSSLLSQISGFCNGSAQPREHFGAGDRGAQCPITVMDLRGNHDTFEVPTRGLSGDFYPRYSSSRSNAGVRYAVVEDVSKDAGSPPIHFAMLDVSPRVGIRGPANFFAHPEDADVDELSRILHSESESAGTQKPVKIVLGHYPLAFVTRSPQGQSVEDALYEQGVDAYLAGHLHYKFGTRMYRWHGAKASNSEGHASRRLRDQGAVGQTSRALSSVPEANSFSPEARGGGGFWELGTGDWKDNRVVRVMAVDRGRLSFNEFRLIADPDSHDAVAPGNVLDGGAPLVLVTSPVDARLAPKSAMEREQGSAAAGAGDGYIRALVFSSEKIERVQANIFEAKDGATATQQAQHRDPSGSDQDDRIYGLVQVVALSQEALKPAQPSELDPAPVPASPVHSGPWDSLQYASGVPGQYWIQIEVTLAGNRTVRVPKQPFVISGGKGSVTWMDLEQTWVETTIIGVDWASWWQLVRWAALGVVLLVLTASKIASLFVLRGTGDDQEIAAAIYQQTQLIPTAATNMGGTPASTAQRSAWTAVKGFSRSLVAFPGHALHFLAFCYVWFAHLPAWWVLGGYSAYLALGPWFWGNAVGPQCPLGRMSLAGWALAPCQLAGGASESLSGMSGMGVPDIVTTVVPILYFSFLPILLWVPLVVAEGAYWYAKGKVSGQSEPLELGADGAPSDPLSNGESETAPLVTALNGEKMTKRSPSRGSLEEDRPEGSASSSSSICEQALSHSLVQGALRNGGGSGAKAQRGCCCSTLSPCSCRACLLRVLLWSLAAFPALVYVHQSRAVANAYGPMAAVLSPGVAWFPGFILLTIAIGFGFSIWKFRCKED